MRKIVRHQKIAFMRHIPPRQIARRIQIRLKRKLVDSLAKPKSVARHAQPPKILNLPHLYAPHGRLHYGAKGWEATFVGILKHLGERIDWNARADDPTSQLWRMNLHYFEFLPQLPPQDAMALIKDWIERCRPRDPTASSAAWTPYAISLRLSAWVDFWAINGHTSDLNFKEIFSGSLREQAQYLLHNLETDVRGNHLIKNIRALLEVGYSFDDKDAKRWRKKAEELLHQELPVQILLDGMHFELSASYHAQVFSDLLTIAHFSKAGPKLLKTLGLMAQALADITHPDGLPVQFNDAGLTMCVLPEAALNAYSAFTTKDALRPRQNIHLSHSGFIGRRFEDVYFLTKMGRLGPDALMAHAHGDWGSFELSYKGQRIFVDQGVYEYISGPRRRQSRSTLSHNTAVIKGIEQADFFGDFRCGVRPNPEPTNVKFEAHTLKISGQISPALNPNLVQKRSFEITSQHLFVRDEGVKDEYLTSRLLLHPDIGATIKGQTIQLTTRSGMINLVFSNNTQLSILPTEWWPNMGQAVQTNRIVAKSKSNLNFKLLYN